MGVKVDADQVHKMFDDMLDIPKSVMATSGRYFKNITPYREGNARRNTNTRDLTIYADYGYAGKLDDGWSPKAPKGMSDPTIDVIEKEIVNELKRL